MRPSPRLGTHRSQQNKTSPASWRPLQPPLKTCHPATKQPTAFSSHSFLECVGCVVEGPAFLAGPRATNFPRVLAPTPTTTKNRSSRREQGDARSWALLLAQWRDRGKASTPLTSMRLPPRLATQRPQQYKTVIPASVARPRATLGKGPAFLAAARATNSATIDPHPRIRHRSQQPPHIPTPAASKSHTIAQPHDSAASHTEPTTK